MADIKEMLKLDALLKLPVKKKVIVLVVLEIIIAGLIFKGLVSPKYGQIGDLKDEFEILSAQVTKNQKIASDIPRFKREKEELEVKLQLALAQLPNSKEIPDLIDSISSAAKKSGLKVKLFQPRSEIPKGFYAEVPVDMEVKGNYESFFMFCDKVSKLPRIVNINNIRVSGDSKDAVKSLAPMLVAKFVVTTFRFIPEEEARAREAAEKEKKKKKKR